MRGPQIREISRSLRRMWIAFLLLLVLLIGGSLGFWLIEDWRLLEAVYMTVITMSTVGYGTLGDLSDGGMVFAIFLIIASAGTFLYSISTLTTFIIEGEIRDVFHQYTITRKVSKLDNHIIICGLGRNGREAAIELMRQNQAFLIIERTDQVIQEFMEAHEGILIVQGDATHEEVLEKANIGKARGLISTLSTDAENVYITLTARTLNPRIKIVARASNESTITKLKRAGANEVIVPNLIGGRKMANIITRPALIEFVEMVSGEGGSHFQLEVFSCGNHPKLLGKTLANLNVRSLTGATVIGLKSGKMHVELNPPPHKILEEEDRIFVLGEKENISQFRKVYLE
jgi:voltage-gated potassium channel